MLSTPLWRDCEPDINRVKRVQIYSDRSQSVFANKFDKFPIVVGFPIICIYKLCPVPTNSSASVVKGVGHSKATVIFIAVVRHRFLLKKTKLLRIFREDRIL